MKSILCQNVRSQEPLQFPFSGAMTRGHTNPPVAYTSSSCVDQSSTLLWASLLGYSVLSPSRSFRDSGLACAFFDAYFRFNSQNCYGFFSSLGSVFGLAEVGERGTGPGQSLFIGKDGTVFSHAESSHPPKRQPAWPGLWTLPSQWQKKELDPGKKRKRESGSSGS